MAVPFSLVLLGLCSCGFSTDSVIVGARDAGEPVSVCAAEGAEADVRPEAVELVQSALSLRPAFASVATVAVAGEKPVQGHQTAEIRRCVKAYADELDKVSAGLGSHIRSHPLEPVHVSSRPLIMVASPGSTATTSIAMALEKLGVRAGHSAALVHLFPLVEGEHGLHGPPNIKYCPEREWAEVEVQSCLDYARTFDYTAVVAAYELEVLVDTPVSELFIDLFLAFPNAKVIYNNRPGDSWIKSREKIGTAMLPVQEPCGLMLVPRKPTNISDEQVLRILNLNEIFVQCIVPSGNLLEFNLWTDPQERLDNLMAELAAFLGKDSNMTNQKFPQSDRTADLHRGEFEHMHRLMQNGHLCQAE